MSSPLRIIQVVCERELSQNNFPNGLLKYLYRMPPNQQVNLDKSFITVRCKLSKADGTTQLQRSDDIAPAYLLAYGLFKQMYQHANGEEIGKIDSYVPQQGALAHRIYNPQSFKDKFLATTNFAEVDFEKRRNEIIDTGINMENIVYIKPDPRPAGAGNGVVLEFLDLVTPNQITFIAAGVGVPDSILFTANGGTAIPDLSKYLQVGESIYFNDGGEKVQSIVSFATTNSPNDTILTSGAVLAVAAANYVAQLRYDKFHINVKESKSRTAQEFEINFKPPMGCWHRNVWLPSHDMCLSMYPHPAGTYEKMVIESLDSDKTAGVDYSFEVIDMIMYLAVKDAKHESGQFDVSYEDMRVQLTNITNTSNLDNHFVVDKKSHSFTMCLQDENVENNSLYSASQFRIRNNEQNALTKYFLNFGGFTLPNPYPVLTKTDSVDTLTQRYYESMIYSGAINYKDVESLDDWEKAGAFFTHKFGQAGHKQTERVIVSTLFTDGAFAADHRPNLLLIDHFKRTMKMTVGHNGKISEISADRIN